MFVSLLLGRLSSLCSLFAVSLASLSHLVSGTDAGAGVGVGVGVGIGVGVRIGAEIFSAP